MLVIARTPAVAETPTTAGKKAIARRKARVGTPTTSAIAGRPETVRKSGVKKPQQHQKCWH